jgi:hypothetical protein
MLLVILPPELVEPLMFVLAFTRDVNLMMFVLLMHVTLKLESVLLHQNHHQIMILAKFGSVPIINGHQPQRIALVQALTVLLTLAKLELEIVLPLLSHVQQPMSHLWANAVLAPIKLCVLLLMSV